MSRDQLEGWIVRLDRFSERVGRSISWLTLAMVVATFTVVVLRYLFNIGWIALQESVVYLHALVFLLAAGYTLRHDGHVRVDIFYRDRSRRHRALINLLGTLFLLLPVALFLLVISWEYVAASWAVFEGSQEAGGIPARFLLKSALLLMPLLLLLQGVAEGLRNLLLWRGGDAPLPDDAEGGL